MSAPLSSKQMTVCGGKTHFLFKITRFFVPVFDLANFKLFSTLTYMPPQGHTKLWLVYDDPQIFYFLIKKQQLQKKVTNKYIEK